MAIHHPTPPLGGGERPRLPSAQVGPVTRALRAMRAAEPKVITDDNIHSDLRAMRSAEPIKLANAVPTWGHAACAHVGASIRALSRTEVEDLIGGLIDLLDAMDGDPDTEQDAGEMPEGVWAQGGVVSEDDEPSLSGLIVGWPSDGGDDREHDEAEGRDPIPDWCGRGVHEVFVGRRA